MKTHMSADGIQGHVFTNVFSKSSHDVYLYDSLYTTLVSSTVTQVTTPLHASDCPDTITIVQWQLQFHWSWSQDMLTVMNYPFVRSTDVYISLTRQLHCLKMRRYLRSTKTWKTCRHISLDNKTALKLKTLAGSTAANITIQMFNGKPDSFLISPPTQKPTMQITGFCSSILAINWKNVNIISEEEATQFRFAPLIQTSFFMCLFLVIYWEAHTAQKYISNSVVC